MSKFKEKNPIARAVKYALLAGATMTALSSPVIFAEDEDDEDDADESTITVTGSRIKRSEFSSSAPINVFSSEDIDNSGLISPDDFLKTKPAFTGYQQTASTNNGGDGRKKVDMRGLGFERTLILINGRRTIGDLNGDGAVDLGTIPMAMVDRVEVLKDGASTVYGTDAIAGVVNYVFKDNFEGFEFKVNGGVTSEDDAANRGWSALLGIASQKGSVLMSAEHQIQNEMLQGDRPWAYDALFSLVQEDGSFLPIASGSSNSRRIRGITNLNGNYIVDETTGVVRAFTSADTYNYGPVNALITPNERWQFAVKGDYQISDSLEVFASGIYTRRTSHQRLAPDASFAVSNSQVNSITGELQWNDTVPASNPYNPFGSVNCDNEWDVCDSDVRINRRFEESGGRLFLQGNDQFRIVTGMRGELTNNISWEFAYTHAEEEDIAETQNYHRFDKWEIAVTPELCDADPACAAAGVLNPFAPFGTITQDQLSFIMAGGLKDSAVGSMTMYQFGLTGETDYQMGGGPIGWAVGYEKRRETGRFTPDTFSASGLTTGGANDPQAGGYEVEESYAEVVLPVTEDLIVDLSTRIASYDTSAGSTAIFKAGVDWAVTDDIRVRAGAGTGFRAPNISELFQDEQTSFPVMEPLCEFSDRRTDITDQIQTNCDLIFGSYLGAPSYQGSDGQLGFAWQSTYTTSAPAGTDLKPEESTNINLGVVFDELFLEGLTVSFDYWKIEVDNFIGSANLNDIFRQCLDTDGLTGVSCAVFSDYLPADNSDGFYDLFPNATGMPIDFIFPADGVSEFGNLGVVTTDGIDIELHYSTEINFLGANKLDMRFGTTYVSSYETDYELTGTTELVGTADGFAVFPEFRTNTSVMISNDNWSLSYNTFYISETIDRWRPAYLTDDNVAESTLTHDLIGTYRYENYSFIIGVNNFTNEDPPRFHSAFNANTEPGMYDVLGRRVFAQAKVAF